jgi:hypothetical protein
MNEPPILLRRAAHRGNASRILKQKEDPGHVLTLPHDHPIATGSGDEVEAGASAWTSHATWHEAWLDAMGFESPERDREPVGLSNDLQPHAI